ncbi:MAG: hypothetical protein Q9175_005214 [Cornicularia normoerica]
MAVESRTSDDCVKFLQTLRSLAASVYPIGPMTGSEHRFDWITAHETYKTWFNSPTPSVLHVHGPTDTSDALEFIFRCLDVHREAQQKRGILTYFAFKKHDDRYNSVTAMLNTLLVQIFSECQDLYNAVKLPFEEMSHHSSWTQTDLLLLFRTMLSSWDHGGILCVIDSMNECDNSRMAFLEDICSFARHTERRFKIAITSTADCDLQSVLTDWPTINLDDHQQDSHTINSRLASDIDLEVLELMQQRPKFHEFEKRITENLFACGQETHWRRLILNQLRFGENSSTKLEIERQLDVLPPTPPKEVLVRILAGIPLRRQQWARRVLVWTLYTFRSLSVSELGVALMFQDQSSPNLIEDFDALVYQDITGELDEVFKGIFIVKHTEVHFSHPNAREFLLKADCGPKTAWYDVKETAHQEITEACFSYLSLRQVQKSIAASYIYPPADLLESPTYIPQYSLCSYAIKYWPRHYELISNIVRPTRSALEFCRTTKALRLWAQAYWAVWKPISHTDRVFLSILPTLTGLGLQDLVTEWLDPEPQPNRITDYAAALTEAARNTKTEVVRKLLPIGEYSQSDLQDALTAASSCCDEAILDLLITHIAEHSEDFPWPPALLCRAAQFGLENVVRNLLKFGASLEAAITLHKLTPLHLAARHGQAEVVRVLLEKGARLAALDEKGLTPLHYASKYSYANVLSLLLDASADCNAVDIDNNTALGFACNNGNLMVVRMLLTKSECDMGSDRRGQLSPLSVASAKGFFSCAQFLLDKNAKMEVQEVEDRTPLCYAALNGHVELCQLLLKHGANPNDSIEENPILSVVATRGNLEIVKVLVENGAEIDATDSEDQTALLKASNMGHTTLVACLLGYGANVYHEDVHGSTSIQYAASRGYMEIVQFLNDSGADLQGPSSSGWTPLHLCYDQPEITSFLLKNGANVNSVTKDGYTPLYVATVNNNPEVMKLLLEAGANINLRYTRNKFPLQIAVTMNLEEVLRVLMEYNPNVDFVDDDGDTALNCINSDTSLTIAKILVNGGADPNIRDKMQDTPICTAALRRNSEILKYLTKKAELDIVGGKLGGPLHIACSQSDLHLVKILVDADANVDLVDPVVGTPLHSACCWRTEEQESVIFYLINEANVDLKIVGGSYGCALNAACGWSSFEVVRLMLEKGARIDVKDDMGRMAIHFAAARNMENFRAILECEADVKVADAMGRTALHWASVGGMVNVVNQIIALSGALVDQADLDGWTPLLWAARGSDFQQTRVSCSAQEEVIKLLLDRGADPCVRTKGLDREWSPVKVARYHGVDSRVIRLLEEKAKEKLSATRGEVAWDDRLHESRAAAGENNAWCDCCFSFKSIGPEYLIESEASDFESEEPEDEE